MIKMVNFVLPVFPTIKFLNNAKIYSKDDTPLNMLEYT